MSQILAYILRPGYAEQISEACMPDAALEVGSTDRPSRI